MLGELSKLEIQNLLLSQNLGRLACCADNKPYIVPVTYVYDGKFIYGQTNEGTKLDILRKNPSVCFEVDAMSSMTNWQCAIVFGRFEELTGAEAVTGRNILFGKVFSLMTSKTIHKHEHSSDDEAVDDARRVKYVMYRISINEVTGRFES